MNWKKKVIEGVQPDLNRLADHRNQGRCLYAGMLLVDETMACTYPGSTSSTGTTGIVHKLAVDTRPSTIPG